MLPRIICVLVILATPALLIAEEKVALLVGVTTYQHSRMNTSTLKYPEVDAKSVSELLSESGYRVVTLTGKRATKEKVSSALKSISGRGDSDGVILLGFFGHGVQYGSEAYFCPYDTSMRLVKDSDGKTLYEGGRPRVEPDPASLVPMRTMLETLTLSGAGNRMLIADCCREDPNSARGLSSRAFGSSVRVDQLPRNCACLFACSRGELAYESDDWGHGAFTRALLDACVDRQRVTANGLSESVYLGVEKLVSAQGKRQRVNSILSAGLVDLKITDVRRPKTAPKRMEPSKASAHEETPRSFVNSTGGKMVLIRAGTFLMGLPDSNRWKLNFDEKPQHRVTISKSFYMGETEVTQGQWRKVMGTNPWNGKDDVKEGADYPATYVGWDDAVEFCHRLSDQEGRTYRLPTEAEWEYACRAGSQAAYPFGDNSTNLKDYAWFKENTYFVGERYAHLVAQKRANAVGLFDMQGNVWEWCSDVYGDYEPGTVTDPGGPSSGSNRVDRVGRGGSWDASDNECRSTFRYWRSPENRWYNMGFRLVSVSQ